MEDKISVPETDRREVISHAIRYTNFRREATPVCSSRSALSIVDVAFIYRHVTVSTVFNVF